MITREILESAEQSKDWYRNLLYTSNQDQSIEQVYLSPRGIQLHQLGIELAELADLSLEPRPDQQSYHGLEGNTSTVTQESLLIRGEKVNFAVKRIFPSRLTLTGLEQFLAMRILAEYEVQVACPFIARRSILVTEWVDGEPINQEEPNFKKYIKKLLDLKTTLTGDDLWTPRWCIDPNPQNYRVTKRDTDNLFEQFTAIDPVYHDFSLGDTVSKSWKTLILNPIAAVTSNY